MFFQSSFVLRRIHAKFFGNILQRLGAFFTLFRFGGFSVGRFADFLKRRSDVQAVVQLSDLVPDRGNLPFRQAVLVNQRVDAALQVEPLFSVHLALSRGFAFAHLGLKRGSFLAQVWRGYARLHLGNQSGVLCSQVYELLIQRLLGVALLGCNFLGQLFNIAHDALVLNSSGAALVVQRLQFTVRVCAVFKQRFLLVVVQFREQISAFALDALQLFAFAFLNGAGFAASFFWGKSNSGCAVCAAQTSAVLQHVNQPLALTQLLIQRCPQRSSVGVRSQIVEQFCVAVFKSCFKQVGWAKDVQNCGLEQGATDVFLCPRHCVLRLIERIHGTKDFGCVLGLDGFVQCFLGQVRFLLCSLHRR